ncbi:hypothetical protein BCE_1200 [Bacillus cereus ATCC 10987]|uniref:Uncharacterized protein n=1 Tax=Bacillus cereus (strain ATCC 10987 / NRS 248) TaxID=222523 RepID=Q73C67_BACC1|nr:hypothetical protein BCE_1200 [Bacillus cereus ATCC 10987]
MFKQLLRNIFLLPSINKGITVKGGTFTPGI